MRWESLSRCPLPLCSSNPSLCQQAPSAHHHLHPAPSPLQGPDSLAVLRWFAEGGPLVRAVRGNHDIMALQNYRRML